jgi:hypothetical protein
LRVDNGRSVAWSTDTPFTTLNAAGNDSPVDCERLDSDVKGLINWMTDDRREALRQAQENATKTADGMLAGYADSRSLRRELASTYGKAKASWSEDIYVATGPNSAIVQQLIQLNTELDDKADAGIVQLLSTRVDNVEGQYSAVADAIMDVNASVDGTVANSGWRMTSTVGAGGTSARISAYARINMGDTWKQAGWLINVTPTGSQFIVVSNQFAIADPNNNGTFTYPFVVQNGQVYIQNARLGTLYFDVLQSNNGKMIMRGYDNLADLRIFT